MHKEPKQQSEIEIWDKWEMKICKQQSEGKWRYAGSKARLKCATYSGIQI